MVKRHLKINCPVCRNIISTSDIIVIDLCHTLYHHKCYNGSSANILQIGSYKEITRDFPYLYKTCQLVKLNNENNWREQDHISREVKLIVNDVGDEIELEVIQYSDQFKVVATICQDAPPFKDYIGVGNDKHSVTNAARKALKELYAQAYFNNGTLSN